MILLSRVPRRVRMLVAGSGALAATLSSLAGGPILQTSLALGVMAVALAFRLELRLDTRSRRYDRSDGVWPALSRRRGSLDELRWVHIEVYETTTHVDIHGVETIGRTYEVQLVWGREHPALPWKVYRGRDYGPAAAKATELADTLGLSVAEGSLLRRIRPELGSAPYDSRLALPTKERMASVLARVRQ